MTGDSASANEAENVNDIDNLSYNSKYDTIISNIKVIEVKQWIGTSNAKKCFHMNIKNLLHQLLKEPAIALHPYEYDEDNLDTTTNKYENSIPT